MTALPKIRCNDYVFTPKENVSDVSYKISLPMKVDECLISTFKNSFSQGEPEKVNPNKFLTNKDLEVLDSIDTRAGLTFLGAVISTLVASSSFSFSFTTKKDYKFSLMSAAAAGILDIGCWYFIRQARKASFDVANKVLSAQQNATELLFKPSDYGL